MTEGFDVATRVISGAPAAFSRLSLLDATAQVDRRAGRARSGCQRQLCAAFRLEAQEDHLQAAHQSKGSFSFRRRENVRDLAQTDAIGRMRRKRANGARSSVPTGFTSTSPVFPKDLRFFSVAVADWRRRRAACGGMNCPSTVRVLRRTGHPILKFVTCNDDFGAPRRSIEPSAPSDSRLPPEPSLVSAANAFARVV